MGTLKCRGKLIDISKPKLMGILNITPDSFFDGGENNSLKSALKQTEKMLSEGADFIDIGGMSSRPGAELISFEEEKKRILPVINAIVQEFPNAILSIDTFRSEIAKITINEGASVINDISGGDMDEKMFQTIASLKCPYILMHMRGNSKTMQSLTEYENVTIDVINELSKKIERLHKLNISDIIIDPGFGFSKTIEQNYQLLNELDIFSKVLELPILAGISRKSMIYKQLNIEPKDALNATTALNMVALQKGAKILRVHDVKEAKQVLDLYLALTKI